MSHLSISNITNAVRGHTPRRIGRNRYYSVLLPLVEKEDELYVLFEVRSHRLNAQPGEVSFPGGAIEEDETPAETAIRETSEELGLPENAIELITELDYLVILNGYKLHCFLGTIGLPSLGKSIINKDEVEECFLVPLSWFLENDPTVYSNQIMVEPPDDFPIDKVKPGNDYSRFRGTNSVPVYLWQDPEAGVERAIWGMTANLTMAFVELIRGKNL